MSLVSPIIQDVHKKDIQHEELQQFISFTIDDEEYAVSIMAVKEIKGWISATRLPNAPVFIRGIINLRGLMVPVLDLRVRFGRDETIITPMHVMVIVKIEHRTIGILVDAVSDILTVPLSAIKETPDIEDRHESAYISGLLPIEEKMVAILDLPKLFDLSQVEHALSDVSTTNH